MQPHNDLKEVREHYGALRDLVIQNPGGWDDVVTRGRITALCDEAKAALDDAECLERLGAVEKQAAELYSAQAHEKWARKNMSGADYLRLQILISLEALNTRLFFLQTLRDRAQSMLVVGRAATDTP
jgi:hypothetical protein